MRRYFIFLMALLCSCSKYKGSKDSLKYDNIKIEFYGYSKDYKTKEKLIISITDSTVVKKLNNLKNISQRKWFGDTKGTEYIVRLVYTDSNTGEQLLISISKSKNSQPVIEYGSGTIFDRMYKNDEFFNYVTSIIKLENIKQYEGGLSQEEYEKLILNDNH